MLEFRFIFGNNGYEVSKAMREAVFRDELNRTSVSDEFEDESYHFVGYEKTSQISAARLLKTGERVFEISYLAVKKDYRRQYVGDLIVRALADKAVSLGGTDLTAKVPCDVREFFEYEGFEKFGEKYMHEECEYIIMKKDLLKPQKCRGCEK